MFSVTNLLAIIFRLIYVTYFLKPVRSFGCIVNNLHAPVTLDNVTKLVCLKDWLKSVDWVCELNNNSDSNNMTDWYRYDSGDHYFRGC